MHTSGHHGEPSQSGAPSLQGAIGASCTRELAVGSLVEQLGGAIEGLQRLCADHVRVWPNSDPSQLRAAYPWKMEIFTNPIGGEPGKFTSEMTLGFKTRESALAYYALRSIREGYSPDLKEILANDSQRIGLGSNTLKVLIYNPQ